MNYKESIEDINHGSDNWKSSKFHKEIKKKVSFCSLSSFILALAWAHCSSGIRRSEKRYKKFYKFKITSVEMIKYFHNNFFTLFLPNDDEEASDDVNKFFTPPFINFSFNAEWLATRTLNYCTTSYFLFYFYIFPFFWGWRKSFPLFVLCLHPLEKNIQLRLTKMGQNFFFSPNFTHRIFIAVMVVAANIIFHMNALQTFWKDFSHSKIYRENCESEGAMRKIIFNYPHYDDIHCEA